jgi:hypothetical protein
MFSFVELKLFVSVLAPVFKMEPAPDARSGPNYSWW